MLFICCQMPFWWRGMGVGREARDGPGEKMK